MKGKIIRNLKEFNKKLVWVEFGDPNTVGCANDDDYALGGVEAQLYSSGVYRVDGHFLVSQKDANLSFHEFIPRIIAVYEWR
jgi:hypothetical protein